MRIKQDISQYIKSHSKRKRHKNAIIFQNKKIKYGDLEKIISNLSISLNNFGINQGDRIAVALSNSLEFVYILFAAARIGATIIPCNVSLPAKILKKNFSQTKI